eukprot:7443565-Pyramimonas_sp.AAC.1
MAWSCPLSVIAQASTVVSLPGRRGWARTTHGPFLLCGGDSTCTSVHPAAPSQVLSSWAVHVRGTCRIRHAAGRVVTACASSTSIPTTPRLFPPPFRRTIVALVVEATRPCTRR